MKKLLYCIILSSVILGCGNTNNNEIYSIGTEIAEGVGTSLAVGFSLMDSDLTYKIITSNDEFTSQGNTWPIIDVSVIVKSDVLSNPKITFVMLLEIDNSSGTIAGTVKNIKADGLADSSLDVMNNTMYIKTDEGIEQVQIIDGELRFIEQAEINTAHQSEIVSKDFYIIATDIASNENEASEKVNKLKAAGYASDYLWIPDYKSLSGAEYFSVFIGPFRSESECAIAVQEYRKNNPSAYGLLVSNESSKRVSITGPNKIKITEGKKPNIQATDSSKTSASVETTEGTKSCLIGYDWVYPSSSNPSGAWKFSSDGTFNSSTTMFGGMSAWGNWSVTSSGKIQISYTKTTKGTVPGNQMLTMSSCNNLRVGSTSYLKD